jgi:adenylate cyclase
VAEADLKHRLAAILAADAAGYSRLMAGDERGTVAALDSARVAFRKHIESSQGRVIDMAGDSVLAVFESAAGAVNASLAVQAELEALSAAQPEDRRMRFRIGVHLGDVIEKRDGTVYVDGVNIAARLQALAEPGGLWVSDAVRGAMKSRIAASFEDCGEQQMKNIAEPVRAYRVRTETAATTQATFKATASVTEVDLSLPDKPSIAVLPFTNMSGDPDQEYLADGMVEDIITELSRFQGLFVIARNTAFTYKGRSVDVKKVAAEWPRCSSSSLQASQTLRKSTKGVIGRRSSGLGEQPRAQRTHGRLVRWRGHAMQVAVPAAGDLDPLHTGRRGVT